LVQVVPVVANFSSYIDQTVSANVANFSWECSYSRSTVSSALAIVVLQRCEFVKSSKSAFHEESLKTSRTTSPNFSAVRSKGVNVCLNVRERCIVDTLLEGRAIKGIHADRSTWRYSVPSERDSEETSSWIMWTEGSS